MQASGQAFTAKAESHYRNDLPNQGRITTPGSQYLLKLIKGGYLEDFSRAGRLKVLDVGCGGGFDLVTIERLGWEAYGCEISQKIVEHAKANAARFGCSPIVEKGENQRIPFESDFFDMLWSNQVIHYLDSRGAVREALAEYARVLKPSGRIILQTTHPDNWLLTGALPQGGNLWKLQCPSDFRHGEIFHVFKDEADLKDALAPYFRDLKVGMNVLEFFEKTLKQWIITGVKS